MEPPLWHARFNRLRWLFWLFFLITCSYIFWVRTYLQPLSWDEIVRLEIAKTVNNARSIIQDWKLAGKYEQSIKGNYLSFVFIVLYTISIALGCRFLSACTGNEILIKGGKGFAWLIGGAAICDLVENFSLSRTLRGNFSHSNIMLAYNLARVKFSLVIVCILFMLVCLLYWVIGLLSNARDAKNDKI